MLDRLLGIEAYRARIDGRQEVMVGYSDSAKDVGRLDGRLGALQGAGSNRRRLPAARRHVTLFHGRGGSVGRGGGPTYLALQSQPPGSIDGTLRVTEQGEMIQALFGLPDIAVRTMEVYTSGTLESWLTSAGARRTANGATAWSGCRTTRGAPIAPYVRRIPRSSTTSAPRRRYSSWTR